MRLAGTSLVCRQVSRKPDPLTPQAGGSGFSLTEAPAVRFCLRYARGYGLEEAERATSFAETLWKE